MGGVQAQGRRASWNLSRGRRNEAGERAPGGPLAFRKRRAPGRRRRAVQEVSVVWARGAGTRGGTAQPVSYRARGDDAETPEVL